MRESASVRDALSATSAEFREPVEGWLSAHGEVLLLSRLTRSAGRKDWYLLRRLQDLDVVISRLRPSDCLTAFAGRHLPHRGQAEDLVGVALNLVAAVEESVFGELTPDDPELLAAFAAAPGDEGWVAEWLADRRGRYVAFGEYPPFLSPDTAVALDGIVPDADGTVTRGVY